MASTTLRQAHVINTTHIPALLLLTTVFAILLGLIDCERFPQSPARPAKPDPIDPTGRNSPGIVIVYKKGGSGGGGGNERQQNSYEDSRGYPDHGGHSTHRDRPPNYQAPAWGGNKHRPNCAGGDESYCLYDRDYPMDKVSNIANHYQHYLSSLYEEMNHYSVHDYINHDNATHNYRHKGHFICESDVSYVRPGWAKNWKGEWIAVLNTDVFPQSVRIETCKYPKKKCEYMPPCYKSYCVQRYTYVKLICLDPYNPNKRPTTDVFEIPSACSCFVENFPLY
ncbi:neurotrophin 1 [Folsomia candida]|uniref:neurotrophin 1 n=1 Tax=Folsomia candida TaxID=158441 RepID=UPI000B8F665D|nr:neurotrophin 1 [Folsomia candida]